MFGFRRGGFLVSGVTSVAGVPGDVRRLGNHSTTLWSQVATPSAGILALALLTATAGAADDDGPRARADGQSDHHWLACVTTVTLPRTVSIGAGVDVALARSAMDEWNTAFGAVFVEVAPSVIERPDVEIVMDSSTWVELPCRTNHSTVHLGGQTNLAYWLTHELGHTLGLADHIRLVDDGSRYINPGHCPQDGYDGVMSYCTPRERWFGADDLEMIRTLFPQPSSLRQGAGVQAAGRTIRSSLPLIARDH